MWRGITRSALLTLAALRRLIFSLHCGLVTPGKALGDSTCLPAYDWLPINQTERNMHVAHHSEVDQDEDEREIFDQQTTTLPIYGKKPKKPGLYLGLLHGRRHAQEAMNGWGFDGPTIGPLRWCHTTYASDIKIEFEDEADAVEYFGESHSQVQMTVDADMLIYDGCYFGDWTVYYVEPEDCERPPDTFRKTERVNNLLAHRKYFF